MADICWCKKQSKGIKLIEPNDNLAEEYLKSSEETLEVLREIKNMSKMWLATTKYYFEYFTIYAMLMRFGIKCEIHDCTIELTKLLEKYKFLPSNTYEKITEDKELRIDNQYHLKNREVNVNYQELLEFYLCIKDKIQKITLEEINKIREIVSKF